MIEITIPMPPSINAMYINRPKGQRGRGRILSQDAKLFKYGVGTLVNNAMALHDVGIDPDGKYGLVIVMRTKRPNRDVSNILKITEDAVFEAAGVDDSHDVLIVIRKEQSGHEDCLVVFGTEAEIVGHLKRTLLAS